MLKNILTSQGVLLSLLGTIGMVFTASGHPVLGAFFADPSTGTTVSLAITALLTVAGGAAQGIKKP